TRVHRRDWSCACRRSAQRFGRREQTLDVGGRDARACPARRLAAHHARGANERRERIVETGGGEVRAVEQAPHPAAERELARAARRKRRPSSATSGSCVVAW